MGEPEHWNSKPKETEEFTRSEAVRQCLAESLDFWLSGYLYLSQKFVTDPGLNDSIWKTCITSLRNNNNNKKKVFNCQEVYLFIYLCFLKNVAVLTYSGLLS